jgi:hypothetical protein
MTVSSGIEVTLSWLPQQSEKLQCWHYWLERFENTALIRWHDVHTVLYNSQLRHLNNMKVITWTVWEAGVLVFEMERSYDVCHYHGLRYNYVHTKFLDIQLVQRLLHQLFDKLLLLLLLLLSLSLSLLLLLYHSLIDSGVHNHWI